VLANKLFVAGLVLEAGFGVAHFGGFLQACRAARQDPGLADLTRDMRAHVQPLLGFRPSILDFREYFSANFSVLLLLAAGLGFAGLAVAADRTAAIRVFSPIYTAAMVLLLGTSIYFSVVQGIITCSCIAVLFALAWRFA